MFLATRMPRNQPTNLRPRLLLKNLSSLTVKGSPIIYYIPILVSHTMVTEFELLTSNPDCKSTQALDLPSSAFVVSTPAFRQLDSSAMQELEVDTGPSSYSGA